MKQRFTASIATLVLVLGGLAVTGATIGAGPAEAHRHSPRPVSDHTVADPSVVPYGTGFLAISTGEGAPGAVASSAFGEWHRTGPLLRNLPHWAKNHLVWAADAAQVGRRWVMYYSVPVRGIGHDARCIGVAVSSNPAHGFDAHGRRPLVCPSGAHARADDRLRGRARSLPRRGVIDPSYFHRGERSYLLYRTQGTPATIRIVRLHHQGLRAAHHSHQILRTRRITENPVLVKHGHRYVLFASQGYYGSCSYATSWRASRSLRHFPTHGHRLLSRHRTRICGPGGLDVAGRTVFFHGWLCGDEGRHCRRSHDYTHRAAARRLMYAGRLHWRHGRPHVQVLRG